MDNDGSSGDTGVTGSLIEKRAAQVLSSLAGLVMAALIAILVVVAIYMLRWRMGW